MPRGDNQEIIEELFCRMHSEFGGMAPKIINVMVSVLGGTRITFPDLKYLYRQERDRRIRAEFKGDNHEELAIRYGLKVRWVREILLRG
jgi:Mor family transcriptional regulator